MNEINYKNKTELMKQFVLKENEFNGVLEHLTFNNAIMLVKDGITICLIDYDEFHLAYGKWIDVYIHNMTIRQKHINEIQKFEFINKLYKRGCNGKLYPWGVERNI